MTKAVIQAIVNEVGGPEYIVGMRFANGTKQYFGRYALSMDDFIELGGMELLKLKHKDTFGNEAVSYLDVSEIVQIYTIADIEAGIILRDILD